MNPFNKIISDKNQIIKFVETSLISKNPFLLTYFNQHCFNIWYKNDNYKNLLKNNYNYFIDGTGIYYAYKIFSKTNIQKLNASEINEQIFDYLIKNKLPIILIGGDFSSKILKLKGLEISLYLNGYDDLDNFNGVKKKISNSLSKIIIIGLGVPLQEEFGNKIFKEFNDTQIICVGNFLEFYFGSIKRAPKIFNNSGFEWIFRIISEPKRLWKRYILGIPLFIFRIIKLKYLK